MIPGWDMDEILSVLCGNICQNIVIPGVVVVFLVYRNLTIEF